MNAVSIRGDWVGQVIDGRFPLLEWLGGSGTSGVFVTEIDGSTKAAIKLIPASARAEDRLANWALAASLSHRHLIRVFHFGRAQVGDVALVYIVTELAEEVLSQIIPERALSADEAREMLNPVLKGLAYLHASGFVHGHLKPSNTITNC
jgi:serine/threonine protein kinase